MIAERNPDTYELLENVTTVAGARTMAEDPGTGRIYLAAPDAASHGLSLLILEP